MSSGRQQEQKYCTLSEVNKTIGSLKGFYISLRLKGIYLPEFRSKCISSQYLLGIATKKYFSLPSNQITIVSLQNNFTKMQLFFTLYKIAVIQKVYLGFNTKHLPNKEWLINVIHTLDSQNDIFKDPQNVLLSSITKEELKLLQDLSRSLGKTKHRRMFKSTKAQRKNRDFLKLQHRIVQQENQLDVMIFEQKNQSGKVFKLKKKLEKIKASLQEDSNSSSSSNNEDKQIKKQRII